MLGPSAPALSSQVLDSLTALIFLAEITLSSLNWHSSKGLAVRTYYVLALAAFGKQDILLSKALIMLI